MRDEISTPQAAELIGVAQQTIRSWCHRDMVKHRRVGLRQAYRIDRQDLLRVAEELGYLPGNETQ